MDITKKIQQLSEINTFGIVQRDSSLFAAVYIAKKVKELGIDFSARMTDHSSGIIVTVNSNDYVVGAGYNAVYMEAYHSTNKVGIVNVFEREFDFSTL